MAFTPWIRSPFSDVTGALVTHQWYGRCADLELKLLDCMEAYGINRAETKCETLIKDFNECNSRSKQINRCLAMRKERLRQYKEGERTKENLYAPTPSFDSYKQ